VSAGAEREILTIEEAAELLGVSVKTFNKVLHSQSLPARKIGREWKFSRRALIEWVGSGRSDQFYREAAAASGEERVEELADGNTVIKPKPREESRRTTGWRVEYD
jgi:excisionase family DNA binding protein